jgi:hypothetical protein
MKAKSQEKEVSGLLYFVKAREASGRLNATRPLTD